MSWWNVNVEVSYYTSVEVDADTIGEAIEKAKRKAQEDLEIYERLTGDAYIEESEE